MTAALDEAARDRIRREQEQINLEQIRKHGAEARETRGLPIPRDAPGVRAADWTHALAKKGERFAGDERNVAMALRTAPELRALVRHNRFSQAVELTRSPPWRSATPGESWTDDDDVALQIWLQERGLDVRSRATVGAPVVLDAKERPYHPVLAYLKGLRWDGTARLDTWLMDYLDCEGPPEYLRAVGRAWLVSAVARIQFTQRLCPDHGQDVNLQLPQFLFRVGRRPGAPMLRDPLQGDPLEGAGFPILACLTGGLLGCVRFNSLTE